MTTHIGSGTAQGLLEFLDQLVEKGRATNGSVSPLKTTVRQVISIVDGKDKWLESDIRKLDVSDYIDRFATKTMGRYNSDSLVSYKSRLNKAKKWYTTFLVNPGWTPKTSINKVIKTSTEGNAKIVRAVKPEDKKTLISTNQIQNDLIAYPFPLREGKIVHLYLPSNLTLVEAKRLGKYLESLSIDGLKEEVDLQK